MASLQMRPEEWLQVIRAEYLEDFVLRGGAAVKFVVPTGEQERSALQAGLETAATDMDAYELLREFVDGADELSNCLVVVVASPEFLTDPIRGLGCYEALKLRIWDEVRDREVPNPMAALTRLGSAAPARLPVYLEERNEQAHG